LFFAATHSIEPGAHYFSIICGLRYAEAYRRELDHFIGAIASGTTPLVGGGEGVKALALADAALESFRTGRAIGIWSADSGEHSQENGARLGGTGRPLVRSV
jgi:myo-inositol 2-dehydrogenase/D-chiro-inositol 1-dehydrogenase